jgi:agmatine/peptidylarginine deiminase
MANDNWIRDITPNFTMQHIADYVLMWELVNEAGFYPQEEEEDEIVWTRTSDGAYSAKLAYEMQFEGNLA